MGCWHEDDRFWRIIASYLFPRNRWEMASREIDGVLQLTATPPGSRVLDLGCGPGRHSLELARRGYRVTAVDRTGHYLDQLQAKAREEGLVIEIVAEDMRRFIRPGAFHLALSLFTSFGYFQDPDEDLKVARNVRASLKEGGRLVMELMGREVLNRVFRPRDWQPTEDGGFLLEERHPSEDWTWMENRWILVRDGTTEEFRISHRIYGAADLSRLLKEAGFQKTALYGGLADTPYDHTAKRLAVVAVK